MSLESETVERHKTIRDRLWGRPEPRMSIQTKLEGIPPTLHPLARWVYSIESDDLPGEGVPTNLTPAKITEIRVRSILESMGENFNRVRGKSRDKNAVLARRAVASYLFQEVGWSVSEIGRYLKKDHSTAINLLKPYKRQEKYRRTLLRNMEAAANAQPVDYRKRPRRTVALIGE